MLIVVKPALFARLRMSSQNEEIRMKASKGAQKGRALLDEFSVALGIELA
jgi:hypothetical protein